MKSLSLTRDARGLWRCLTPVRWAPQLSVTGPQARPADALCWAALTDAERGCGESLIYFSFRGLNKNIFVGILGHGDVRRGENGIWFCLEGLV